VEEPEGVAIDPAHNKIYWASYSPANKISVANLDGSGEGKDLNTAGATLEDPDGVAIDPAHNKIYWVNYSNKISVANLDGSGEGKDLSTTGATVSGPFGVAIDPAHNRIYWANFAGNKISVANLDGSGEGKDLSTTGATVSGPVGVAIDTVHNRIYWANYFGNKISVANLDGSGEATDMNTTGAIVNGPKGVAIDPTHNKIYWANQNSAKISVANLDGSGEGKDLKTTGASAIATVFPALLQPPVGAGAPMLSGAGAVGSAMSCSQGSWDSDLLGGFLFQAPRAFTYAWELNGADIPGAVAQTLTAGAPGSYSCRVSASNQAGSTTQTSAQVSVSVALPIPVSLVPALSSVSQSHSIWRRGSGLATISRARRAPVGTTFAFTLNEDATVRLTFTHKARGRRVGKRCVIPNVRNIHKRKCSRTITAGTLSLAGHTGSDKVRFRGRISSSRRLATGRYTVTITAATTTGQHSPPRALSFTIVK
jgi:6-phosphogluconolactonase (cycloisomerase 2 family)